MPEPTPDPTPSSPNDADYTAEFARTVAAEVEQFLVNLQAVSRAPADGRVVSLLLLEVSQILLTGARLGAQDDFAPREEFQPDVGPEADTDELRMRLAGLLGNVDTYSFVFDPYDPEQVESQLSDDLASIATDLENGLRHYRRGDVVEALWWWQFSYLSGWGQTAAECLLDTLHRDSAYFARSGKSWAANAVARSAAASSASS